MSDFHSSHPQIKNMIAVVTGAGSGVGEAVTKRLVQHGCRVVLVGRTEAKLERVQRAIGIEPEAVITVSCDVSNPEQASHLKSIVLDKLGTPHLIFNRGLHCDLVAIAESTPSEWINTFAVNSIGPYLICHAFMQEMVELGWGRIINVSSAASLGRPGNIGAVYQLSKVTLNHFTRQLANELKDTGVTANVLHPGEVKTEMWSAIKTNAELKATSAKTMLEWSRWVEKTGGDPPEKTADLVLELLSPKADAVNGQFLWIKDGLKTPMPSW